MRRCREHLRRRRESSVARDFGTQCAERKRSPSIHELWKNARRNPNCIAQRPTPLPRVRVEHLCCACIRAFTHHRAAQPVRDEIWNHQHVARAFKWPRGISRISGELVKRVERLKRNTCVAIDVRVAETTTNLGKRLLCARVAVRGDRLHQLSRAIEKRVVNSPCIHSDRIDRALARCNAQPIENRPPQTVDIPTPPPADISPPHRRIRKAMQLAHCKRRVADTHFHHAATRCAEIDRDVSPHG